MMQPGGGFVHTLAGLLARAPWGRRGRWVSLASRLGGGPAGAGVGGAGSGGGGVGVGPEPGLTWPVTMAQLQEWAEAVRARGAARAEEAARGAPLPEWR